MIYFVVFISFLLGCEDAPPTDYVQQYYVEAYLIVDEPVDGLKLQRTLPIQDSFKLEKALVKDAIVKIKFEDKEIQLAFRDTGDIDNKAYYFPDTSFKVQPNTTYHLEILTSDGVKITGTTITPQRFEWIEKPPDTLYYPKDSVNFSDGKTARVKWTSVPGTLFYLAMYKCLDTIDYGKYLTPQTEEKNRRTYRPNARSGMDYNEITAWDGVANVEYPIIWMRFKWFGKHRMVIYAPDFNYLRWTLQYFRTQQINPLLSSVSNAVGVFGSASKIEAEFFLMKNQP